MPFLGRTPTGNLTRTAYYDSEADRYDASRGGAARARAAAAAIDALVPLRGRALDVAGGTGIVTAELARLGWDVTVADLSHGMLGVAAGRLPGRVVVASAERLPVAEACLDLVTTIWLLHLLPVPVADAVVAEAARVLRPGGHLVTTVDKDLAHGRARRAADAADRVEMVARRAGLRFTGQSSFRAVSTWGTAVPGEDPVFPVVAYRRA